jgi:hypothetical protein
LARAGLAVRDRKLQIMPEKEFGIAISEGHEEGRANVRLRSPAS